MEVDYEAKGNARRPLREGRRLGCAAAVCADAVIAVPSESQVHKQVVRKGLTVREFEIDPVVRLYYVEVERPTLETPGGDLATEPVGDRAILTAVDNQRGRPHEWQLVADVVAIHLLEQSRGRLGTGRQALKPCEARLLLAAGVTEKDVRQQP